MSAPQAADLPVSRVVIWRHGRTEWNAAGRFQGQLDPPLDTVGRDQAPRAAAHLVAGGLCADNTVVVSSDLRRAAETAATLTTLLGVPLRLDRRLREHGLGTWEGLTRDEVAARYPDQYADWLAGRPVVGRGGEDAGQVTARALAAMAELPRMPNAVLVTHGGTASRLIEALLRLEPDHRRVFGPLGNCSWSELAAHDGRWRLMRHNNSAPQPAEAPGDGAQPAVAAGRDEQAARVGDADAVL